MHFDIAPNQKSYSTRKNERASCRLPWLDRQKSHKQDKRRAANWHASCPVYTLVQTAFTSDSQISAGLSTPI